MFNTISLLAPALLKTKVLLRRTLEGDCAKLKWDEGLLGDLVQDLVAFFVELFGLEDIVFPRSLLP